MIFFMTVIVPHSNLNRELSLIQKKIFSTYSLIIPPFPLLPIALSRSKPERPTRKEVNERLPETLTFMEFHRNKSHIILKIKESISVNSEPDLDISGITKENGFIIAAFNEKNTESFLKLSLPNTLSFSKYSLTCYEINCDDLFQFWKSMSWNKLWEVKKGKIAI